MDPPGKERIAGLDEAGRGAVIGPLVVAGVAIRREQEADLRAIKVRDSKELSPRQRELLAAKIEALAEDIVILKVNACRLDTLMGQGINLNRIEEMKFVDILKVLRPALAYVDSPDVKPERLKKVLEKESGVAVLASHKADSLYPVVSAASIIAKVNRDQEVRELHKEYGDFGPGYSSNPVTIQWMKAWLLEKGSFPDIVRKRWMTTKDMQRGKAQQGLGGFLAQQDCPPKGGKG